MAKFNADSNKRLLEPLEFTLGGKTFTVREVTDDLMAQCEAVADAGADGKKPLGVVQCETLALLTGEPPESFEGANVRQRAAVMQWVTQAIADPLGAGQPKNARS